MSTPDELRAQAAQLIRQAAQREIRLSQADVHKMYVEKRYEEIEQARKDGRIDAIAQPMKET